MTRHRFVARAALMTGLAFALSGMAAPPRAAVAQDLPRVEAFARLPAVDDPKISPDGSHLGFLTSINGKSHLVIQGLMKETATEPVTVAPEDLEIVDFGWANDERLLIHARFTGRGVTVPGYGTVGRDKVEERRVFGMNRDGTGLRELTDPRRRSRFVPSGESVYLHRLPDDPRHVLVLGRADVFGWPALSKLDVYTGGLSTVEPGRDNVGRWLVDRAGVARVGIKQKDEATTLLARRSADEDFQEIHSRQGDDGPVFFIIGFSNGDPDILYVASTHEGPRQAVYEYSIGRRAFGARIADHPRVDVGSGLFVDWELVGISYTADTREQIFFDPDIQALRDAIDAALPGTREQLVQWSEGARTVLIRSEAPDRAPAYLLYDAVERQIVPLGEQYPELREVPLSKMSAVDYAARDGMVIPAMLTLPRNITPAKLPFVILVHGGPHARDSLRFDWMAQFLASRGYGVLQPNFRGSTGYGADLRMAGRGQWGKAMQDDVTDGTNWLIEQGLADADRICIMGGSYGGYAALMGVIREQGLYRCAVSINGVANLPKIWDDFRYSEMKRTVRDSLGDSRGDLEQTSPYHRAQDVSAPVLLIHARGDTVVPSLDSEDMAGALKSAGKPVDLLLLDGGSHWLLDAWHRIDALKAVDPFLKSHIGK